VTVDADRGSSGMAGGRIEAPGPGWPAVEGGRLSPPGPRRSGRPSPAVRGGYGRGEGPEPAGRRPV